MLLPNFRWSNIYFVFVSKNFVSHIRDTYLVSSETPKYNGTTLTCQPQSEIFLQWLRAINTNEETSLLIASLNYKL